MRAILSLALLSALARAAQLPLSFQREGGFLAPESSPAYITSEGFTTFSHPDHKDHSVRIKKTTGWCDSDVSSYAGYLDHGVKHLFFYFFESRNKPDEDPLVLWTNGGPGGSSSIGLLMELGPCSINADGNSTRHNPHSWNSNANMIYIDQPTGVGFSYSDAENVVGTTEEAARDVAVFLRLFQEAFPSFRYRETHLSGESYAGRYLPLFATEVLFQNELLAESKSSTASPINLKSVLIGNGLSDFATRMSTFYAQTCTSSNGLGRPVLGVKACVAMQPEVQRCNTWLADVCRTRMIQPECDIAAAYCNDVFQTPYEKAKLNPFDMSMKCPYLEEDDCYPETKHIEQYLNQAWVRTTLGISDSFGHFEIGSSKVAEAFDLTRDIYGPSFLHLTALLERGIRVLIYVGKLDIRCNYFANSQMIHALEWSGQAGFVAESLRNWTASDKLANTSEGQREAEHKGTVTGETKSFGDLTYATIEGAGHLVPFDKPREALYMVEQWLAKQPL